VAYRTNVHISTGCALDPVLKGCHLVFSSPSSFFSFFFSFFPFTFSSPITNHKFVPQQSQHGFTTRITHVLIKKYNHRSTRITKPIIHTSHEHLKIHKYHKNHKPHYNTFTKPHRVSLGHPRWPQGPACRPQALQRLSMPQLPPTGHAREKSKRREGGRMS
jgi:hypothetical protein